MQTRKLLSSKFLFTILLVVFFFSLSFLVRSYLTQRKIASEKRTAEERLAVLERDNEDLKNSFSENNLDFYGEKELKLRLGLVRPGEKTIIISQEQNFFPSNNQVAGTSSTKFNWQKWFNYFFGK